MSIASTWPTSHECEDAVEWDPTRKSWEYLDWFTRVSQDNAEEYGIEATQEDEIALKELVAVLVSNLTPRQYAVIRRRFLDGSGEKENRRTVASELSIAPATVSSIEENAFRRMRNAFVLDKRLRRHKPWWYFT